MYVMQPASRDCSIKGKKLVEPVVVIIEHWNYDFSDCPRSKDKFSESSQCTKNHYNIVK